MSSTTFNISNPGSNTQKEFTNIQQFPLATKIAYLDPSYTGLATNIFTTWQTAYNDIKNATGIRAISFVKQPGDTLAGQDNYFSGASGTYDMANIYLYYDDARQQSVRPTAGFTLQDLSGIISINGTLSILPTNITQNFIALTSDPDNLAKNIIFHNILTLGDPPIGTYILYTSKNIGDVYTTMRVIYSGRFIGQLVTNRFMLADNGIDIILDFTTPSLSFFSASSIETTGDLTIDQLVPLNSIPLLAAAYTEVGGAVAFNMKSIRCKITNANPTVTDDGNGTSNYAIGTLWVNTATNDSFICANNANGAAVWTAL